MTQFHDISVLISPQVPTWPGDRFLLHRVEEIAKGDVCNKSFLEIGSHIATHVDAPYHFEPKGITVDQISPDVFVGPAKVVAFPDVDKIAAAEIRAVSPIGAERILFKTRNSFLWEESAFQEDYVHLTPDACRILAESGIKLIGVDYLSIEEYGSESFEGHHVLLTRGIVLLEGLDLREVEPGEYELIALPLKISGGDGSPVRAILREVESTP